jgi:SAM-dependent methyltransferase
MTDITPQYFSFRDNAARVVERNGIYYRYIFQEYKNEYDHLISSGLYTKLLENNLLISHAEVTRDNELPQVYKVIKPEQISFLSYPFEWSYSQWRKVVLSYIEINLIALNYGMILKDATPYNFYLNKGNGVLLDTTSFTFFQQPNYWTSYRQFCEEMLGPFSLMHYNGHKWGRLTQASHNGLSLAFISRNLPYKSWLNLTCLIHLHLHSKSYNKPVNYEQEEHLGLNIEKLNELLSMLKITITKWDKCYQYKNHWLTYYEKDIETEEYLLDKEITIKELIKYCNPKSVLDLGANTGKFSEIATQFADSVIALEFDERCVDEIENRISENKNSNLNTLLGDLSETSPDFGLNGKEHKSIFKRAKSDLVLSLALVHHLALPKMIPFELISKLLYEFSNCFVIIEFIEKSDRKVKQLLKENPRYYPTKTEFENIIISDFTIINQKTLSKSVRTIYLLEKHKLTT